MTISGE